MNYSKILVKVAAIGLFLWCMTWILSDILVWGHDVGQLPPQNVLGVILGPVLFIFAGRLSGPLSKLIDRLPLPKKKPPEPGPSSWGRKKSRSKPAARRPKPPRAGPDPAPSAAPAPSTRPGHIWLKPTGFKISRQKIRIPGFRTFKRLTAFICMVFNFLIGELALTGPAGNQIFAVFFLINSFLLADYLWKTQKKAEPGTEK